MSGQRQQPGRYVKEVFNRARQSAPALVFIDEIEALAPNRDEFRGGILTELLQELDGVKELKNVMLVGATNKPYALDPAILRPGRFDKIIYIPPPDAPARKQIFTINMAKFLESWTWTSWPLQPRDSRARTSPRSARRPRCSWCATGCRARPSVATTDSMMKSHFLAPPLDNREGFARILRLHAGVWGKEIILFPDWVSPEGARLIC